MTDGIEVVGFTGSRTGMTPEQAEEVAGCLRFLVYGASGQLVVHHGDCLGADAQFHAIARAQGCRVVGHPPDRDASRAFCEFDEMLEPEPYLTRNLHIVRDVTVLIAAVPGPEVLRSGTWATVRYARRAKKLRMLVWPNGNTTLR